MATSVPAAAVLVAGDARASVSIAVAFDALVEQSTAVAVVTPIEQRSVWEEGRIYTYTRAHADRAIAGDLAEGSETWIRTMGGAVGHIGQLVDGEPVFTIGRPALLFLHPGPAGATEVTARAQGQFPVLLDDTAGSNAAGTPSNAPARLKLIRAGSVGALLQPKPAGVQTPSAPAAAPRLAQDVLHNVGLEDGVKAIGAAWSRLHAPSTPSRAK